MKKFINWKSAVIGYIFVVLCIVILGIVAYKINVKVNIIKYNYDNLNSKMTDVMAKDPIVMSKEIEHYSQITDSTLGSINSAVAIMSVIATLFGLIGILFTIISLVKNKEVDDIIKSYRSELDDINIIQHILYADKYRRQSKTHYAINEYRLALRLDEDNCIVKYELGSILADEYASNPEERTFVMAKENLKNAIDCCIERGATDRELLSDCYLALGVIYGQNAKIVKDKSGDANELFDESINNFLKAIINNKYNIEIYSNMALTYIYYEKKDEAKKCFEKAIEMDKQNVYKNNVTRQYHNPDELLAIVKTEIEKEKPKYKYDFITDEWKHRVALQIKES